MSQKKETALASGRGARDPIAMLRQMTSELDRVFAEPFGLRWPTLRAVASSALPDWSPEIDVFERDHRLITKIDLPGLKKEDVRVEVTDGCLIIAGERKSESEERKDNIYRSERSYGTFHRAVSLPEGVKLADIKATFTEGVLEVSVPLPVQAEAKVQQVEIQDGPKAAKSAA